VVPIRADADDGWLGRLTEVAVVFVALHGGFGEDGSVQGVLEILRLPYTGSGVLASALGMNKAAAKRLWVSCGLPTPRWQTFSQSAADEALSLPFPVVVKPNGQGSSVGVAIVHSPQELRRARDEAYRYDPLVLVEEYIAGKEVTVGVLGERAIGAMEVVARGEPFPTFQVKYTAGREEFIMPAPLAAEIYDRVLDTGYLAHRALGCDGYSRIDTRVTPAGHVFLLEVNTLPGLTPLSYLPRIAAHAGLGFDDLVEAVLDLASLKAARSVE